MQQKTKKAHTCKAGCLLACVIKKRNGCDTGSTLHTHIHCIRTYTVYAHTLHTHIHCIRTYLEAIDVGDACGQLGRDQGGVVLAALHGGERCTHTCMRSSVCVSVFVHCVCVHCVCIVCVHCVHVCVFVCIVCIVCVCVCALRVPACMCPCLQAHLRAGRTKLKCNSTACTLAVGCNAAAVKQDKRSSPVHL